MTRHPRGARETATRPRAGDPRAHWIVIAWLASRQGGVRRPVTFICYHLQLKLLTPFCYDFPYNPPLGPAIFGLKLYTLRVMTKDGR